MIFRISKEYQILKRIINEVSDCLEKLEVSLRILLNSFQNFFSVMKASTADKALKLKLKIFLPKISLPVFSETFCDWPSSKAQFTNLLTNNYQLNDTDKLYYSRASLKGSVRIIR